MLSLSTSKLRKRRLKVSKHRNKPTCCHDACGGDRQHCDVLGAVRRVEVRRTTSLASSICLGPRRGDGEKSRLVVRCRGSRERSAFFLLLFYFV